MKTRPDILQQILRRKAEEITERCRRAGLREVKERAAGQAPPRGFTAALAERIARGEPAVVAEIKRASPSKGVLREDYDPAAIAASYEIGGAAALSVLTDRDFFQGDDGHLIAAKSACALPVLRKDFTIDPYQVYEARSLGADCVLLIVAALADARLEELAELSSDLGMDVLVEVHDAAELERANRLGPALLGINNRNLHTFDTRLETTLELMDRIPENTIVIAESGIHLAEDVALMRRQGVNAFLVGEAFMRSDDPGLRLSELFGLERIRPGGCPNTA